MKNYAIKNIFGVGSTEFFIIIGLLSLIALAVLPKLSDALQNKAANLAIEIAGGESDHLNTLQPFDQTEDPSRALRLNTLQTQQITTQQRGLAEIILANLEEFGSGLLSGLTNQGQDLLQMLLHPIESVQSFYSLAEMLIQEPALIAQAFLDEFNENLDSFKNGDARAIGILIGENVSPATVLNATKKAAALGAVTSKTKKQKNVVPPLDYDHIIKGDFSKDGKRATGGHSLQNSNVRIVQGTESAADAHGVYTATIEMLHPETQRWVKKKSKAHTMFPKNWSTHKIKAEVDSAWKNRIVNRNRWGGVSDLGVMIEGFIEDRVTAHPIIQEF